MEPFPREAGQGVSFGKKVLFFYPGIGRQEEINVYYITVSEVKTVLGDIVTHSLIFSFIHLFFLGALEWQIIENLT